MRENRCPREEELLPLSAGERLGDVVERHVQGCRDCQARVAQLRAEMQTLYSFASSARPEMRATAPSGTVGTPVAIQRYWVVGELPCPAPWAQAYRVLHPVIKQEFTLLLGAEPIRLETPRRRQLVEEIRKLTEVHHPRLASVHDLDFHENRPVLVTELVRGRPLAEEFGVVRPPAADAAMWLAEVAHGLSALHGVGAIHGLVSPATIVVDEQGLPRLLHAGLSLLAPESTRADHSPRKDVVALAAVLCFLLSGCETESAKLNSANAPDRLKALCRQGFVDEVSRDAKHFASELEERAGARSLLGRAVASLQGWLKPRREV